MVGGKAVTEMGPEKGHQVKRFKATTESNVINRVARRLTGRDQSFTKGHFS